MLPVDEHDTLAFLLRQDSGPQLRLDFGTRLTAPPNGLKANQVVEVVGVWDAGVHAIFMHLRF